VTLAPLRFNHDLLESRLVTVDHRLDAEVLSYVLPAVGRIYPFQLATLYRSYHLIPLASAH
jgi:hypothetical protein